MILEKIKQLEAVKAKAAELEAEISADLNSTLAGLPAHYGFATTEAFLSAVRQAAGGGKTPQGKKGGAKTAGKRRRAKITDETRAAVKKLVAEKKTGAEIARALGISLPSVQKIKTALGLVTKRKK